MATTIYLPDPQWGFKAATASKLRQDGPKYGFTITEEEVESKDKWGWDTWKIKTIITPKAHKLKPYKDTQKVQVYRAEWKLKEDKPAEFQELHQMREFVAESWAALKVDIPAPAVNWHDNPNNCTAYVYQGWIGMSKKPWAHNRITLLHEMAHMLSPHGEYHGPLFARTMLDLVVKFMDNETASQLFQNYLTGTEHHGRYQWERVPTPDGGMSYQRGKQVRKGRVTKPEIGAPRLGLARLGMQTGFSTGVPATNLVSPIVARQIGMEVA